MSNFILNYFWQGKAQLIFWQFHSRRVSARIPKLPAARSGDASSP
jgi:hypothetical protein